MLAIARESIDTGLANGLRGAFSRPIAYAPLREPGASFVTLREHASHALRGCCGSLEARLPLAEDVWRNARASAFGDPRFPTLTRSEWSEIELHISVLSAQEPFAVGSELELLTTLRPNVDGLVLEYGPHRATFLPSVWDELSDPREFVRHLLAKAGLSPSFWSPQIQWSRYTVQEFGERAQDSQSAPPHR